MMGTVVDTVYEYVEAPPSTEARKASEQKRHLALQAVLMTEAAPRTLCGKRVQPEWIRGDETLTGTAATCRTCQKRSRR